MDFTPMLASSSLKPSFSKWVKIESNGSMRGRFGLGSIECESKFKCIEDATGGMFSFLYTVGGTDFTTGSCVLVISTPCSFWVVDETVSFVSALRLRDKLDSVTSDDDVFTNAELNNWLLVVEEAVFVFKNDDVVVGMVVVVFKNDDVAVGMVVVVFRNDDDVVGKAELVLSADAWPVVPNRFELNCVEGDVNVCFDCSSEDGLLKVLVNNNEFVRPVFKLDEFSVLVVFNVELVFGLLKMDDFVERSGFVVLMRDDEYPVESGFFGSDISAEKTTVFTQNLTIYEVISDFQKLWSNH